MKTSSREVGEVGGGVSINNSLTFHVKIVNKAGGSGVGGRGAARGAKLLRSEGTALPRVRGSRCELPATGPTHRKGMNRTESKNIPTNMRK